MSFKVTHEPAVGRNPWRWQRVSVDQARAPVPTGTKPSYRGRTRGQLAPQRTTTGGCLRHASFAAVLPGSQDLDGRFVRLLAGIPIPLGPVVSAKNASSPPWGQPSA